METTGKKVPRGIRNNNPLNIRKGCSWKGERPNQTDKQFEQFISIEWGIRAAFKLLRNHISGFKGTRPKMNTYRKIITMWAPPSENATEEYINYVCRQCQAQPSDIIDPDNRKQMVWLAREMAFVECGQYIDMQKFESAWDLLV